MNVWDSVINNVKYYIVRPSCQMQIERFDFFSYFFHRKYKTTKSYNWKLNENFYGVQNAYMNDNDVEFYTMHIPDGYVQMCFSYYMKYANIPFTLYMISMVMMWNLITQSRFQMKSIQKCLAMRSNDVTLEYVLIIQRSFHVNVLNFWLTNEFMSQLMMMWNLFSKHSMWMLWNERGSLNHIHRLNASFSLCND